MRSTPLFSTVVVLLLASGCGSSESSGQEGPFAVSYEVDIQPIWDDRCLGCHSLYTPHLTAGESRKNLLGEVSWEECIDDEHMPHVVSGKPEKSFLLYRLTGHWPEPVNIACTSLMPADWIGNDTPLESFDPDAVERIRTWIKQGAPDN